VTEKEIEETLQEYGAAKNDGEIISAENIKNKNKKKKTKNQPVFNTRLYLRQIHKVDVTEIME